MLPHDKANIPSQADDDITDVSSENTDTLPSEAPLDGDQRTFDQETNQASLQGLRECLRHSSRDPRDPSKNCKTLRLGTHIIIHS